MEVDPKLVVLIISNQVNGQELFRVHIHELSIRFDDKFQEGIENNSELRNEIDYINELWKKNKIKQNQIFPIMLDILVRHGDYLRDYFFDAKDLDKNGQFIDANNQEKKPGLFFSSLKKQKLLKKITKKEFQNNIKSFEISTKYVEKLIPKAKYYFYQHYKNTKIKENWFFMEKDNDLILCYRNK